MVAALEPLRHLTTEVNRFEILVAEGCLPSRQRNEAAQAAGGEILYFLDDDSRVRPDCLNTCTPIFADGRVAAVGGPSLTPADNSALQQLFGLALSSLFGAGGMRNRYRNIGNIRETTDKELILCNLAMRRSTFLEAGGLDERLYPNEENELLDRILADGSRLMHAPELAVYRSQRATLRQFTRQMYSYGRGRAQQTLISGSAQLIGFVPLLFVIYLLLLPFALSIPLVYVPLYVYAALNACFTAAAVYSSGSVTAASLLFLFPLMHISNGVGLVSGLAGGKNGKTKTSDTPPICIKKIKGFDQTTW
jgi:cellulose synthase/poly-beta-1,6-N-acetylglucosamine synthase-like glycosyltransferase